MQGYLVKISGDYFGNASEFDRKREKFPYTITVKVPRAEGCLSLIKNKLLDKALRRNYNNYHIWRTHQLVSITNLDGSKVHGLSDPRLMDFNDLADYVRKHKLPLKLELYTDLDYFRRMVYLAETNQHEFRIKQEQLAVDYAEDMQLAELNPELLGSQGSQSDEHQRQVTKKALKDARDDGIHKTIITEGKRRTVKHMETQAGKLEQTVDDEMPSALLNEVKLDQNIEKVYVKGMGYIDVKDFKENFDRPEEKEYETYDPHKLNTTSSDDIPDEYPEVDPSKRGEDEGDEYVEGVDAGEMEEHPKEFADVEDL